MKKILIVETNVNQYKGTNKATGLWLGETVEFLAEIYKYQFEADFVSPLGGYVPIDPRSMRNLDSDVIDLYSNKAFIEEYVVSCKRKEQRLYCYLLYWWGWAWCHVGFSRE